MNTYGLIGKTLKHSFSKKYFTEKFEKEGITGCEYQLFELAKIHEFRTLVTNTPTLKGLNVTIPYKQEVIPFLSRLSPQAEKIGAVNVIKFEKDGSLTGYNSDYEGFKNSLLTFLDGKTPQKALILGTGGASKAVKVALEDLNIAVQFVSRTATENQLSYEALSEYIMEQHQLIINTTPLGTYPNVDDFPKIPYQAVSSAHFCYDLVYNPATTEFMKRSQQNGAKVMNGLPMLIGQAEAAWEIWKR